MPSTDLQPIVCQQEPVEKPSLRVFEKGRGADAYEESVRDFSLWFF